MTENCTIIYTYTRKEAIADGILVDTTEAAKQAGFSMPVALTSAVWGKYVAIPNGLTGQDESARLWDVLWMLYVAIRVNRNATGNIRYRLHVRNDSGRPRLVELKALCGPGDDGEPCITVMLPGED